MGGPAEGWTDAAPAEESRARYQRLMESQRKSARDREAKPGGEAFRGKLVQGDHARDAGDKPGAVWSYLQALEIEPGDPAPAERIAYMHLEEGEPEEAQAIFEALRERDPESYRSYLGLGLTHLGQGDLDQAIDQLEYALELKPDSVRALAGLAIAHERRGDSEQAEHKLRVASELAPKDGRIRSNLGAVQLLNGRYADAEKSLRRALVLDPTDTVGRNNLGVALGMQGEFAAALRAFRKAGTEQAAQNNLGYVYFLQGHYDEALAHYEQALILEGPDEMTILRNVQAALRARGDEGDASPPAELDPAADAID